MTALNMVYQGRKITMAKTKRTSKKAIKKTETVDLWEPVFEINRKVQELAKSAEHLSKLSIKHI